MPGRRRGMSSRCASRAGSPPGEVRGEPAGVGLARGELVCSRARRHVAGLGGEAHLLVLGYMGVGLVIGIDRAWDGLYRCITCV